MALAVSSSKWLMNEKEATVKLRSTVTRQSYSVLDIRLGEMCGAGDVVNGKLPCCCCGNGIPLYKYTDTPEYLHGNPYVVSGYRAQLSFSHCVQSMFSCNNDTVNIWSHLIGFLIFFFYLIYDNVYALPFKAEYALDHLFVSLGLICYQFCMICSTGYHIFRCHSEQMHSLWLALDLTGISVGLLGCYLPGIHYGFYCLSVWRDVYLIIIAILFGAVLFYQTRPRYYTHRWFRARVMLYSSLAAYGLIPIFHWVYLNGGTQAPLVQVFAPKIMIVYLLGFLAALFYVTKFPERWFPGKFDYIGSSHQCWHVIVVVAFIWWHRCGHQLFLYRLEHPCET